MRYDRSLALALAAAVDIAAAAPCANVTCTGSFKTITAADWVKAAMPGWNAGNTMDALPDEGSWNNPKITPDLFDKIKAAGFKSVRIPVTYTDHFTGSSPDWTIDQKWLDRVSQVVDMALQRNLYVITNMHHDSSWSDVTQAGANLTQLQEKFHAAWKQIATTLACKSELVALEPINEPPGNSATDGQNIGKYNDLFLDAMQTTGGFNAKRVVTLSGPGMDSTKLQWFTKPANIKNPWAFQFHYYSPYDFNFGAWGKTIWGSDADKAAVETDFNNVVGNSTGVPIVLGEFDASQINCEAAGRWKWFDHVVRTAKAKGFAAFLWDNGLDNLNRQTGIWRDYTAINITMSAIKGAKNSLPDSTTDPSATSQSSSAYLFHKVGTAVTAQSLPFLLNGNTIKSITDAATGTALKQGTDYTISGSNISFPVTFLNKYFSTSGTPGSKTNLTVAFSAGAPIPIDVVQWDVPTIASSSAPAKTAVNGTNDLWIPVVWKGVHKVAAVKILESDGTYLVDTWTVYLPTIQQARGTYGNQWNFDQDRLTITNAAVNAVIAAGKTTTFTFEFYPRVAGNGNYVNFTLTV